jgi:hypothetical protein
VRPVGQELRQRALHDGGQHLLFVIVEEVLLEDPHLEQAPGTMIFAVQGDQHPIEHDPAFVVERLLQIRQGQSLVGFLVSRNSDGAHVRLPLRRLSADGQAGCCANGVADDTLRSQPIKQ